jgi:hypothetical protein
LAHSLPLSDEFKDELLPVTQRSGSSQDDADHSRATIATALLAFS